MLQKPAHHGGLTVIPGSVADKMPDVPVLQPTRRFRKFAPK